MADAKHTPGPWGCRDGKIVAVDVKPDWADIDEDFADERVTVVDLFGAMGGDDTSADARLIAAAPELLAALAGMIEMATHHAMDDGEKRAILKAARAAIAKAKGE